MVKLIIFLHSYITQWIGILLSHTSNRNFNRIVEIEGFEQLKNISRNGNGIILVSGHFGYNRSIPLLLLRLGFKNICGVTARGEKISELIKIKFLKNINIYFDIMRKKQQRNSKIRIELNNFYRLAEFCLYHRIQFAME